jgi:uncharacterized Zn finger protein
MSRRKTKGTDDLSYNADEIGVYCDRCRYQTKKSVGWLREHIQVECAACGNVIDVESRNFRSPFSTTK